MLAPRHRKIYVSNFTLRLISIKLTNCKENSSSGKDNQEPQLFGQSGKLLLAFASTIIFGSRPRGKNFPPFMETEYSMPCR
jgi:hypothetical protein